MKRLILLVLLAVFIPSVVVAQAPPPSNYISRQQMFTDAARLINLSKQYISDAANREASMTKVAESQDSMRNVLEWSGSRFFLQYARVYERTIDRSTHTDPGGPVEIGHGDSLDDVLARYILKDNMYGVPDGSRVSSKNSFYIVYEKDGDGHLYGIISHPMSMKLRNSAIAIKNDAELVLASKESAQTKMLENSVKKLREVVQDLQVRSKLEEIYGRIKDSRDRRRAIRDQLTRSLQQASKAAEWLSKISQLRGVLQTGIIAAQVAQELDGISAEEAAQIQDTNTLYKKVDEYRLEQDGITIQIKREIKVIDTEFTERVDDYNQVLEQNGAPRAIKLER